MTAVFIRKWMRLSKMRLQSGAGHISTVNDRDLQNASGMRLDGAV